MDELNILLDGVSKEKNVDSNVKLVLCKAVEEGDFVTVKRFVEENLAILNIDSIIGEKEDPLSIAIEKGYMEIAQYLIAKGASTNFLNKEEMAKVSPYIEAKLEKEIEELVSISIGKEKDRNIAIGFTLHAAIREGSLLKVMILVEKYHVDINFVDPVLEKTALNIAISHGKTEIAEYLKSKGAV